jgi:hypothetical protein
MRRDCDVYVKVGAAEEKETKSEIPSNPVACAVRHHDRDLSGYKARLCTEKTSV